MLLARALAAARAQRAPRLLPNGHTVWVSQLYPVAGATPETPTVTLVEQPPHTLIPSHFHAVNQFQVVIAGQGTLGKRAVRPWTVHYTNGFTGYGPLGAGAAGMAFVTLRNRCDVDGAHFFPAGQAFMQPAPKRHHLVDALDLSSAAALCRRQHVTCDSVLAQEDDGLAVWLLRLGPHMRAYTPDPVHGGGQYLLVANGTLRHDGAWLPHLSCLYVPADAGPSVLQSGAQGLEVLLLQFPVAEAAAMPPSVRAQTRAHTYHAAAAVGGGTPTTADPEHVAVVQQGAAAVAAWRAAHPGERLRLAQADFAGASLRGADLRGARLSAAIFDGADLREVNLQQADLRAASLMEADLTGANLQQTSLVRANLIGARLSRACLARAHLHGAHLTAAHLQEADLRQAYLVGTDLRRADLQGALLDRADLQWANLQETILSGAHLQEASLQESVLGATRFAHTCLRGAQALATCRHQAPSVLDAETLACSGSLPIAFLRGCGWSEARIARLDGGDLAPLR